MLKDNRDQMIFGARIVNSFPRALWYSTFIVFVFLIVMNGIDVPNLIASMAGYHGSIHMFTLDVLPGYTPAYMAEVFSTYGEAGRHAYTTSLMTLDMLFPISYGIFFALLVRRIYKNLNVPVGLVNAMIAMPLLSWMLDWIENSTFVYLMSIFPIQPLALAQFVSFVTLVKVSLYVLTIVSLLVGLILIGKQRFQKS